MDGEHIITQKRRVSASSSCLLQQDWSTSADDGEQNLCPGHTHSSQLLHAPKKKNRANILVKRVFSATTSHQERCFVAGGNGTSLSIKLAHGKFPNTMCPPPPLATTTNVSWSFVDLIVRSHHTVSPVSFGHTPYILPYRSRKAADGVSTPAVSCIPVAAAVVSCCLPAH